MSFMRIAFSIILSITITALVGCLITAVHTKKKIGYSVAFLLAGVTFPVFGNLLIVISSNQLVSTIGYYIYFLGIDASVFSAWRFMYVYCDMGKPKKRWLYLIYALIGIDIIQYILNPFLNHAFTTEQILVGDKPYYRLVPYIGQTYHRAVCYGIFLCVLLFFIVRAIKAPKVYVERFLVMILSMVAVGVVETYYIFSRQPIDTSMLGFGLFGLLVYYFTLQYRPMKVLDKMLASMASDMPEALFFFDKSGKCIWVNEPGRKLIGVAKDKYDDVKTNLEFLFDDVDFGSSGWSKKVILGTGDEAQYTYISMRSAADEEGMITGTYLSVRDITEEQRELDRKMYNATHDSVTGLFTKEYLYECITKRLQNDHKTDYMIAYIEISNIRLVNDVFGTEFGDYAINQVAEFIKNTASEKYIYGRLSEDSFGVLVDKSSFDKYEIEKQLANFIVKDENMEHHLLIHAGIYDITPDDEIDVPIFFNSARLATTMINDAYQEHIVFYDDRLRDKIIHNQLLSNQLQNAIVTRQIKPYLQPIVDSQGLLMGAEALVRWIHPDEGFMNPGSFIPLFERNGLISDVDRHMWECACEILSDWKNRGIDAFISINISPKDFYYLDVVSELKKLIEKYEIDPVKLRIEITETAIITGATNFITIVNELRQYGFIVEMDDFGSGYSSLNLLKDVNIDVIKIDMQFLKDSERNSKAGYIIESIIDMSKKIGVDTLTEGVETAKQFERLYTMGCKLYQGFYFSKPVDLEDFEKQWFD